MKDTWHENFKFNRTGILVELAILIKS